MFLNLDKESEFLYMYKFGSSEFYEYASNQITRLETLNLRLHVENPRRQGDDTVKRDEFQRDYTRVMYSSSFRRLQGKMQLLGLKNDSFFRNRLTHSLEVSQISRAIAEYLGYSSTYTVETASLAHDIGNPPFGHYGEKVLNRISADFGGFEGNAQTLRVLTTLEKKNPDKKGLNLTLRSLLSVTKYYNNNEQLFTTLGENSEKFIYPADYIAINSALEQNGLTDLKFRTLDAQIMDIADEIAYAAHDLEDGLSTKLFTIDDIVFEYTLAVNKRIGDPECSEEEKQEHLTGLNRFKEIVNKSTKIARSSSSFKSSEEFSFILRKELLGNIVNELIRDICFKKLDEKDKREKFSSQDLELSFCSLSSMAKHLKKITFKCINRSDIVQLYEKQGETILKSLYEVYMDNNFNKNNSLLPPEYRSMTGEIEGRYVIDYLAGMMDSFALATYKKFFGEPALDRIYQEYKQIHG